MNEIIENNKIRNEKKIKQICDVLEKAKIPIYHHFFLWNNLKKKEI